MPTDAMEMDDDGPDMDMGGGYYSDNTTPKSVRRVRSHVLPSNGCHGVYKTVYQKGRYKDDAG